MNELHNHTDILISKYLSGNISLEEKKKLDSWLNSSPENTQHYLKSKKAWQLSQNYISPEKAEQDKTNVLIEVQQQQTISFKRTRRQLLIYKIAAMLTIPLTFALSWYFLQNSGQPIPEDFFCELTAPKGHVAKCILPDGSEVWINTGSTLTYNTTSFNQHSREVQLSGEAYFEVTKNIEKPFKVVTEEANIHVTGTEFNVKAYSGSGLFETVLAEGGIEMELNTQIHQKIILAPGEKAVFRKEKREISIEKVEAEFYTSWRNGEILFKDATLNDLVKELERIYDIRFYLKDPQLGKFRFRGMFSYNNNLIEALEKIKRTANIDYYIENKEVWLLKK